MRAFATFLLLIGLLGSVLADGKFFRNKLVEAEPSIPFQRAVLKFDGREQIMLVESTLSGQVGNYGWVIPLPTKPSYVKAVNPAFVEQSFAKAKPVIRRGSSIDPITMVCMFLFALVALTSGLRYKKRELGTRLLFFGLEVGLLFLAFAVFYPVFAQSREGSKADMATSAQRSVEDLGRIGSYDVSIISGEDGTKILEWLKEHDLAVGDDALPVIEAYAKEGWCFMAAEVRKDQDRSYPPHPLKAVFPTNRLVYPMRLTGLQSEPLRLELLVVSSKEASLPGMKAWACDDSPLLVPVGIDSEEDREIYSDWSSGVYAMAKQGMVWTYLRGEFKPSEMRKDFSVSWKPMTRQRMEVWDRKAAVQQGINTSIYTLALAGILVGLVLACWPKITEKIFAVGVLIALLSAVSAGGFWHESVEKVDSVEVYDPRHH